MTSRYLAVVLVLLMCLPLSGCGTLLNLASDEARFVYGGTRLDVEVIGVGLGMWPDSKWPEETGLLFGCGALVDLPLSFAADTLTLPVTVPIALTQGLAAPASSNLPPATSTPQIDTSTPAR